MDRDNSYIPLGEMGAEEYYDEDDFEELDESASRVRLSAFDNEAIDESEDAKLIFKQNNTSDKNFDPHIATGVRLQKVLAHAGIASRRACEDFIKAGRVSVDGIVVTQPGIRVDPAQQVIRLDGSRVLTDADLVTVILHKPAGYVTTMEDPQGRPTIAQFCEQFVAQHAAELINPDGVRLVHVGRLDTQTEGLLLLSNDGELAHRLTHPSYEISKTYVAVVKGKVEPGTARALKNGIRLEDGVTKADRFVIKAASKTESVVEITLHSGKNRIVRRMLANVNHPVKRLVRTRFGTLSLGNLKPGQMRRLSRKDISELQKEIGL